MLLDVGRCYSVTGRIQGVGMVERLLIANRGEIARRILRTCRLLGIETVAVYSDADADEPHVREADRAVAIGPAPAPASYLDRAQVLAAATGAGCDAVHPGYGFLAEDPVFARSVVDAGLTFVGPPADVIALMGDKSAAKRRLAAAGVPVVPGEHRADLADAELIVSGEELGAPLVVKAVAGGGGTGMRVVHDLAELPLALAGARREARAAFGDDRLILERLIARPRHIEVQVLADEHGDVVHLFERECSVQRRHQKLVEEAPSAVVGPRLRARLVDAAVQATREVDYRGAGTLEFLVDGTTLEHEEPAFHFLEMNTRLQVEHPVTELVCGLDLVEWQLRIADGEALAFRQDELTRNGHAIEVRISAEDPVDQLPQTGSIHALDIGDGPGVRADIGPEVGSVVSRHYDPMLGKLIAHGADRGNALARLRAALADTSIRGVVTNVELLGAIIGHAAFAAGDLTTGFLSDHLAGWRPDPLPRRALASAAAALHAHATERTGAPTGAGPWHRLGAVRPGGGGGWPLQLHDPQADDTAAIIVRRSAGRLQITLDGEEIAPGSAREVSTEVVLGADGHRRVWVHDHGHTRVLTEIPSVRHGDARASTRAATFTAPMPGAVLSVEVADGDHVEAGATLAVIEAMKMEHPVVAPAAGTITAVHVLVGQPVDAGTTLLALDPDPLDETTPTVPPGV
ncbi:MAG: biotin carboxylase N-terminal domain-containing protein [Nitriliruptoraceae bacterium]